MDLEHHALIELRDSGAQGNAICGGVDFTFINGVVEPVGLRVFGFGTISEARMDCWAAVWVRGVLHVINAVQHTHCALRRVEHRADQKPPTTEGLTP